MAEQLTLEDELRRRLRNAELPEHPRFDGADYVPQRDDRRLSGQLLRVWQAIQGREWLTLAEISERAEAPQASVSAQLRHLRKRRFGAHVIEREYRGGGLYAYRLADPKA